MVTELKKLLEKKISYEDPETKEKVKGRIGHIIALRHIMNACQGDNNAITDIFDRIDGKTAQRLIGEGIADKHVIIIRNPEAVKEESTGNARIVAEPQAR